MKNLIKTSLLVLFTLFANSAVALSPPNLTNDIPWQDTGGISDPPNTNTATFSGVVDIAAAFNNGRRQEEIQLVLTANSLGNLSLPSQAVWDTMTDDAKGLLILNAERVARAGILTDVIGLPLAGIESHMDNISKNYGDIMHDNNMTGHSAPSGNPNLHGPFFRIEQDADIGSLHRSDILYTSGSSPKHTGGTDHFYGDTFGGNGACHEFIARAENLAFYAVSGTTTIPLPLERAIYTFIYDDASSNWGHREAALLQDETLSQAGSGWGFSNNFGNSNNEGYLGVYVRGSADYKPFPNFNSSFATLVVMNIFDPVNSNCKYNVTLNNTVTGNAQTQVPTLSVANNQWTQIGLNTQPATGNSTVANILADDIIGTYDSVWVVYIYDVSNNAYNKLSLTDTMLPGIGYWLLQLTGNSVTIDMPTSSSGVYVTDSTACPQAFPSGQGCFEIALQSTASSQQWQMLSSPFRSLRFLDDVRIISNTGSCSNGGCTLSEASTNNLVAASFWHYNGTAYNQLTRMEPWEGLWISTLPGSDGLELKLIIPATNSQVDS